MMNFGSYRAVLCKLEKELHLLKLMFKQGINYRHGIPVEKALRNVNKKIISLRNKLEIDPVKLENIEIMNNSYPYLF